jgi:hypothetical protein
MNDVGDLTESFREIERLLKEIGNHLGLGDNILATIFVLVFSFGLLALIIDKVFQIYSHRNDVE